ncbi:MAG: DUF1800 family protein [Verrucomicrobiales bacterium]|nr:DUF1800 family protein [Verrucomicrobiales bacterium]
MTTKIKYVQTAIISIMFSLFVAVGHADALKDTVNKKAAAAKVARDQVSKENDGVRKIIVIQANAARAYADTSRELVAAKKNLAKADETTKSVVQIKITALKGEIQAIKKNRKEIDASLKSAKEKYTEVRRESYPILAAAAEAELSLAEKVAADQAVRLKVANSKAKVATANLNKAKADQAKADKSCKECASQAGRAEKLKQGKKDAAKVAADQAAKQAAAKLISVKKHLAERVLAVKAAEKSLLAANAAVKKSSDAKKIADKNLAAKKTAARLAAETVKGSNLYIFIRELDDAMKDIASAEKALKNNIRAESKAEGRYASAKSVAQKAKEAQVAVEKTLASVKAKKTKAGKDLKVKEAAVTAALAKADKKLTETANVAKQVAEKSLATCEADRAKLKKDLSNKVSTVKQAERKWVSAKAALDKVTAARQLAQNGIAEKREKIPALQDKLANEKVKVEGGLKPMESKAWTYAKARHLMVRAGFGGTPAQVQELYEMGLHDAVDHFVEIYEQPVANIEFDPARLRRTERWASRLPWDERQYMTVKHRNTERKQQSEMRRWWLQRMAESPRPLQEKLTLFWHDHFAVQYKKKYRTYMLFKQNQLFRTYAVDSYAALLRGIVHDPATISYLDNNVNYKNKGNENLGREILELFSMGEGGGYTEDDLREASRALTGYNYDAGTGQYRYLATRHDNKPKKILRSTGNWSGDDLVDIILRQPATAKYISGKMFKFLTHDAPYDETIEKMADVMRYHSYDLRPMLRNLFLSEEFYSEKSMGSHIKGPVELAIGAIRDLGIKDVNYGTIDAATNQMGQLLFEPPNVAGWNEGRIWINAERILIRYNQMARILEQSNVDLVDLLKNDKLDNSEKIVEQLVKACLVVKPDPKKCQALATFLGKLPPQKEWQAKKKEINAKLRAVLVLLMSSPESQLG